MPDIFSKSKRSDIMSKISGKETKPEILVRKYLFAHGLRYRKNVKKLPGKPDIVFGTDMKIAKNPHYRQQIPNSGKKKYRAILFAIKKHMRNCLIWDIRY